MQVHALVLVVRSKRPVAVLDVGLSMQALDFPEARHLDLALTFDADGRGVELAERAPEGSTLVEARSACREREARFGACEAALARGETPADDCPIVKDEQGTPRVTRDMPMGGRGTRAALHGCAWATAQLRETQRESGSGIHARARR